MSRQDKAKSSFLETWFGRQRKEKSGRSSMGGAGPSGAAAGSTGSSGPLPRPHSESDFTDAEEQEFFIEHLDDDTLNEKFEEMLNDMNLSEEKKEPLRQQPVMNKKKMLIMHYKGSSSQENYSKFVKPADYIQYLSLPDLSVNKLYACIESLRIALTNNPLSWVQEFGTKGLIQVLSILNECYRSDTRYDRIQSECIRCLKAIMNNTVGIKQMFSHLEALTILARSLDPTKPSVMLQAVQVLAAVCLIPPDGHEKVVEAITMGGEFKGRERFLPVVQGLRVKTSPTLTVACLQLINAIISTPDDLEFRLHLRNEIMRAGLIDVLETLESNQDISEELSVQLKIFNDHKEEDYFEFVQRFDNVRLELDDINDSFEVLKNIVMDTSAEPYLLSILQHLLFIRDDALIRPAYYKLIEECVSQIVLHKGGCDPDFRVTRRFQIDVQPLIDTLVEKSKAEEERKLEELARKLEEAIAIRQETEAKLLHAEKRLAEFEQGGVPSVGKGNAVPVPPPIPGAVCGPPPPPMPGMMSSPPPPPMPGGTGPSPPPMPGMGGPPPPPPPPPGIGSPVPPPMPGMGGPPPPPFPGMAPMPPPGFAGPSAAMPPVLPHGLKPKKKWEINEPLKRANWKVIQPQKLSENSFWVKVCEEKLAHPDILKGLSQKFSTKSVVKLEDDVDRGGTTKKVKDLKVLDGKAAQNISIMLGGSLKHLPYEAVKRYILQCNETVITDNVLQQLITYLPPPDQLRKLEEFRKNYDDLTEAEQFAITLAEIKRLLPRLKSMSFKLHYREIVQDIKPDIVAGTAACEEVKHSKKFANILELILLVGNYMNTGSRNAQAFGFEISFLPKLTSTKDVQNKTTLLHYLVETIENKFPELLTFHEELSHVDRAARVSMEMVQKTLRQMDGSIRNLETDITNHKIPQSEDDCFSEVMAPFAKKARKHCEILHSMYKNMETLYTDLSEYYAFDKQKYPLEEFFTDVKTFKDAFLQAHKDNLKIRETEEKMRQAREAREKAEQERAERAERKRALVDINAAHTQEGVMDSLLEALQTGSAFSRDQRGKRARPRAAGAERRAQLNRSRSRSGIVSSGLSGRELSDLVNAA